MEIAAATRQQDASLGGSVMLLLLLLMLRSVSVSAAPEIYRCTQEDGTVAFQETPCPESADESDRQSDSGAPAPTDEFFDFVNPFDEPEELPAPSEPAAPVSQDRAECEKATRDAIDTIDLEMREGYTTEQGQQYLAELLRLTQQLRACKQL